MASLIPPRDIVRLRVDLRSESLLTFLLFDVGLHSIIQDAGAAHVVRSVVQDLDRLLGDLRGEHIRLITFLLHDGIDDLVILHRFKFLLVLDELFKCSYLAMSEP
jgi:hypothetical protein